MCQGGLVLVLEAMSTDATPCPPHGPAAWAAHGPAVPVC